MNLDYLLLGEQEFSTRQDLDHADKILYDCVKRIESGEKAMDVAKSAIEQGLTGQEVRLLIKWLKKNRPERRIRVVDAVKRRGI